MASAINKVNEDAAITSLVHIKYVVYFLLLTDTFDKDGTLYSKILRDAVYKKLPAYNPDYIDELILELKEEALIDITYDKRKDELISVGVCTADGLCKLYSAGIAIEDYTKSIEDAIDSYIHDSAGADVAKAKKLKANFECLSATKVIDYTHKEFAKLWRYVYEAFFQETPREFMQKEHGQLKQLRTQYDPAVLYKMIVYFLNNSQEFGKVPNLGLFTYKKDEVYMKLKGKTKKVSGKSFMRKEIKEEEF